MASSIAERASYSPSQEGLLHCRERGPPLSRAKRASSAVEIARASSPSSQDGLLRCGGDFLSTEKIMGLLSVKQRASCIPERVLFPISEGPCSTSNFRRCLLDARGGDCPPCPPGGAAPVHMHYIL